MILSGRWWCIIPSGAVLWIVLVVSFPPPPIFPPLQDSGGPLWAVDSSRDGKGFVQYGLVSSAIGSKRYPCDSSWPTVFMRTSYYIDWIDDIIGSKYTLL